MSNVFFYAPHPDDETLSMGMAAAYYIHNATPVHIVSMSNGSALGVANTLNGSTDTGTPVSCTTPSDHPYIHDPVREYYDLADGVTRLTADAIGALRNMEARSAVAMLAQIPKATAGVQAPVVHHIENLPGDWAGSSSSSTSPVTQEGIDAAKTIIKKYIDTYPNSFHYTMSETDDHHDHAACGIALRQLKNDTVNKVPWDNITYHDALANAMFFVSRLYYMNNYQNGQDVLPFNPQWFPYGSHYQIFADWLKNQVQKVYRAWNPAGGSYGIGYHQVAYQFDLNFGPSVAPANLWHA
jgi:LmbE family N-acetylglucosaminyl deacetylase